MRLSRIVIKNFRRIEYADITLKPTSFIIGQNNLGKSSVIKAVEALLNLGSVKSDDFRILDDGTRAEEIELVGYFTNIPEEVAASRGFRGRVVDGVYTYKKIFKMNTTNPRILTFEYPYRITQEYSGITTWSSLSEKTGLTEEQLAPIIGKKTPKSTLPERWETCIEDAVEWDFSLAPREVDNPGGIPSVVVSKLPRVLHIPSYTKIEDIGKADGNKTFLGECLGILFDSMLSGNPVATSIQDSLATLQSLMSHDREGSMVSELCRQVNEVISSVFPGCGIKITPSLNDLASVIKPQYAVEMFSNVNTDAERQGTGLIRTGVFSILRIHSQLKLQNGSLTRPLLIAFEEPEMYLHPAAANMLRDTIYALGESDQIICTTHSPWMIDLNKDLQSLTKLQLTQDGYTQAVNYGLVEAMQSLVEEEKEHIKMIKTFDDELSRIFFAERCVVVEGDSELIAIKNTLKHIPQPYRREVLSKVQVIKARGKAAILPLVKYLKALSIPIYVIHDRDASKAGAEQFNLPILTAVGSSDYISVLEECLEHCLGYEPPSSDKPYKTYAQTATWSRWEDVPQTWKNVIQRAFGIEIPVAEPEGVA